MRLEILRCLQINNFILKYLNLFLLIFNFNYINNFQQNLYYLLVCIKHFRVILNTKKEGF